MHQLVTLVTAKKIGFNFQESFKTIKEL